MVFGLHIRLFFFAARNVRFQCEGARQLPLSARVDAVMQSTSVWLYSMSADKAGSFDKAEVLEDVNSRRVHVFFLGVLAGASQFVAKVRMDSAS